MSNHRIIQSVLDNFLGTYTSRYSDIDGYWLFGFLVNDIEDVKINLILPSEENDERTPMAIARRLAIIKFAEQAKKASIDISHIREAHLGIIKSPDSRQEFVNVHECFGYNLIFTANAVTNSGKKYQSVMIIFVAPHDPQVEFRSTRRN